MKKQNETTPKAVIVTATKTQTLLDVVRKGNHEQILTALSIKDIETFRNGQNSNHVKNYLECWLYDKFISQDEDENKKIQLHFTNIKTIKVLATVAPYILGLKNFSIEYSRENKSIIFTCHLKTPYGTYRDGLELYGLKFITNNQKEKEQILNATQQDAIDEANSILAAAGLNYYAL